MMLALEDARLTPAEVDKVLLISGVIRMPIVRRFVATIMGKEPERGIDVSRSAAMGAVFRQLLCPGDIFRDILLIDVTSLTLGVEVLGGLKE